MAKRNRKLSYEQKIKEGRGSGSGQDYKPWIQIQDFGSKGRVARGKGIKTGRMHGFLSDLECNYYYYLDISDNVIDIREQYPLLPIEETILIANELGLEHPRNPITKEYEAITTDFFIDFREQDGTLLSKARTLKYKNDLLDKRVLEKFEIERQYFERHGVDWGIVTEDEIDDSVAEFISDLYTYQNLNEIEFYKECDSDELDEMKMYFISQCSSYEGSMKNLCRSFDKNMHMCAGSGITMFKHLLVNKLISINIYEKIDFKTHITITINETNIDIRGVS
jgi:hypothetical protein